MINVVPGTVCQMQEWDKRTRPGSTVFDTIPLSTLWTYAKLARACGSIEDGGIRLYLAKHPALESVQDRCSRLSPAL